jgi:poly(ADP-ribose) glycohydrolase
VLREDVDWGASNKLLTELVVSADGLIEDTKEPHIEIDFANKMIGGGVLGRGAIQEEIRFIISPELIASLLFTARMEDHEVVVIKGSERFSKYSGYSYTFEWAGNFEDNAPLDSQKRRDCTIVAMDALYFGIPTSQYLLGNVEREVKKAFCGFSIDEGGATGKLPIATG